MLSPLQLIIVHDQPSGIQRMHFTENGELQQPTPPARACSEIPTTTTPVAHSEVTDTLSPYPPGNVRVVVHNALTQSTSLLFYAPDPEGPESNKLEVWALPWSDDSHSHTLRNNCQHLNHSLLNPQRCQ